MSDMRIFIDANVLIDLIAQREPYRKSANKLVLMSYFGDADIWVSAKSYTDVFYVLRKHFSSQEIQSLFLQGLGVLKVCSVDGADIREAAERCWPDFEDCLVAVCAEKVRADKFLTRDEEGFSRLSIPAMTPDDFFALLEKETGLTYDEIDWWD